MNRRRNITVLSIVLLAGGILWFTRYRGTGWTQMLNPFYWYHRQRGDDLYHPEEALLLHGNRSLPEVALTFDDGPHSESRAQILDTLKRFGVHATFFDVGSNMARHPDLLQRTLVEGHEVANHTENHNRLDSLPARERHREINDADITYYRITGHHLTLLRPPGMRYNPTVLQETRSLGYIVVSYTTASRDFDESEASDAIADRSLRRTENGSILLLHDYGPTALALPRILDKLRERGLRCVTISQMIDHLPDQARHSAEEFERAHAD
jgi:peptidoglycan/xylan/chitin deacetylase (PgdA/CDA1 family)